MNVISDSGNLSKIEKYNLSLAPNIRRMSDIPDGEVLTCSKWMLYEDMNQKGEMQRILSIMTEEGTYATNSPTFQRDFDTICEIMEGDIFSFSIYRGQTKNEREFITCLLQEI